MKYGFWLLLLLLCPNFIQAQVPSTLGVQGTVTDADDNVVGNGTYSLRFWLYAAEPTSPPDTTQAEWVELHTGVEVTGGYFQVILGSNESMANLPFDERCWFVVEVIPTVGTPWVIDSAIEFVASPFSLNTRALRAADDAIIQADAQTPGSGSIQFQVGANTPITITNDGKIDLAAPTNDTLDVLGIVKAEKFSGDGSELTGLAGTTDNDWSISGNDVYKSSGNVGIGTAAPTSPLQVLGMSNLDGFKFDRLSNVVATTTWTSTGITISGQMHVVFLKSVDSYNGGSQSFAHYMLFAASNSHGGPGSKRWTINVMGSHASDNIGNANLTFRENNGVLEMQRATNTNNSHVEIWDVRIQ